MKTRLLLMLLLAAAVAALAACGGGGSQSVPSNAIAVVDSTSITKTQFDDLMAQAQAQAKAQKQPVPKVGSADYTTLRDHVVGYLVQVTELEQQAAKLGVKVTNAEVTAYLKNIAKLNYGGSEAKLDASIKKSGLTVPQAQFQVMVNLLASKVKTKVTSAAKVTTAQEQQYYNQNKAQYHQAESRNVRHILVSSKTLAKTLETKLANGANFAALAKKYSKDTGTAQAGGAYTAVKGQDVPTFDKAAFSLKTGAISQPVKSPYGWHIIEAVGPIKPAHTQTFAQVQSTIEQSLLQQQQQTIWGAWLTDLQKKYQGKVSYQTGYAPATTATPTTPTTT
ncbi:MAG TPA: peptidylprolyl isomerase [Gaiellaceae bacterium]|nr:peptidylprolyl isomerase [Gaiellaceae bacterium]